MRATSFWCRHALLTTLCAGAAFAGAQEAPPPSAVESPAGLGSPAIVEAFFDGLVRAHLEDHRIAGGTVAVVAGGEVVLAKGYGFADVEARRHVRADQTLFRIGSISKLFTWTAIMQLVEAGVLSLDDDVNQHLGELRVPEAFGEPVRVRHLLTHTPGFEDQVIGLFGRDAGSLRPLAEILRDEMPLRVRPPGQVASYSNHGTGIAAVIVERLSGMAWDDYVEARILQPLGMSHTTFRQPFPEPLAALASNGYRWANRFLVEDFEYVPLAPVGGAGSTAVDMARFMLAHLQLGTLDDATILQPETARRMQSELFRHADGLQSAAHGFYEMSRNGERLIGHGGDTLWFHSEMALLPERGVGLFVSYNSAGGAGVTGHVTSTFMETFFPVGDVAPTAVADAGGVERSARVAGHYRSTRYSHDTLAKLAAAGTIEVSAEEDGSLRTSATGDRHWIEIAPLTYQAEHDGRRIQFREQDGEITHLFLGWVPIASFERVGLAGNPTLHLLIAALGTLVFAAAAIVWPGAAYLRWRHGYRLPPPRRIPRTAKLVTWVAVVLLLLFGAGLVGLAADPNEIVFGAGRGLTMVMTLPLLALPLALVTLYQGVQVWRRRRGEPIARIGYTLVCVSLVAVYWQLWYWNLLGYRF